MTISLVHAFVSTKTDGSDSTLVQPSDWNEAHTLTLAAGKIMGRTTASDGAVQELPLAFTSTWDVTFPLTTGAITGASGTTAQRPAAPTDGMMRWNTTVVNIEVYGNGAWRSPLTDAAAFMTAYAPTGRLTLETGVPVSTSDQAGKSTIFYTPAGVGYAQYPSYDGTTWTARTFTELSNDTTASATNKAGPAAAGPYQIQDLFVWNDSGTDRLTRGPKWTASATVTMTIAAPGVVTHATHGLWDGATVRFTTTGALPTGLAANTDYFITKVDANSYKLSSTLADQVAGTFITTSGSQSGVHTVFNYTSARGSGSGTTELQLLNGVYVNRYDITNGPAATKGTYVGSVYFNASSQIDLKFGTVAANGGEAIIGIWNMFNRVSVGGNVGDSTASWNYSTTTVRPANGSATARVSFVSGLALESSRAKYTASAGSVGSTISAGVGYNTSTAFSGIVPWVSLLSSTYDSASGEHAVRAIGFGYFSALEYFSTGSATTWIGTQTGNQTGLTFDFTY